MPDSPDDQHSIPVPRNSRFRNPRPQARSRSIDSLRRTFRVSRSPVTELVAVNTHTSRHRPPSNVQKYLAYNKKSFLLRKRSLLDTGHHQTSSNLLPPLLPLGQTIGFDINKMTTDIFSDTDICMTCAKPLKDNNGPYCDDICKAKDGYGRHLASETEDPSSIMASLPALLASTIKSGRAHGQDASASTSSQSETSSPLQSPSPFAHPVLGLESSPKEDAFTLPPPAYPNNLYHNAFNASSNPVKIPASHKASSPGYEAAHSHRESYKESVHGTPTRGGESTLRYARRPGHTNSVTSPLALYPVGAHKRPESHSGSRPSTGMGSPAFVPLRNVSDTNSNAGLQEKRKSFAYGTHSPLLLAANASRPASSAVDFQNARASPRDQSPNGLATSSAALRSAQRTASDRPSRSGSRSREIARQSAGMDVRRKSFPAHLFAGLRPKLTSSATQTQTPTRGVLDSSSEGEEEEELEDVLVEKEEEAFTRRGRSRDRKLSFTEREHSPHSRSRSRNTSSHLGLEGMAPARTGRSRSRLFDRESTGDRRTSLGRRARSRSRSRSHDRERSGSDERPVMQSEVKPIGSTPLHNGRNNYLGRDLATIVGSLQIDHQQARSARDTQRMEDDYERVHSTSPLATVRASRQAHPGDAYGLQHKEMSPKPTRQQGPIVSPRGRADRLDSKAARELKRLFEEGVTVS